MGRKGMLRPVPVIEDELRFSRKKKSRLLSDISAIPRSPIKSAPPVSRIFRNRASSTPGACAVSFRESQIKREVNIQSPLYTNFNQLYFEQCFTRLSFLGTGSFGQVVKVQSKEDGKLYAVKKSCQRFRSDSDRRQRLEEVNKNEQIAEHPNCVRFYKAWEEQDHLYIQTELCEMSLKDYAESVQSIEEKEIWNIIIGLCNGLKHLHDAELAHVDIKPANLFLGRDGFYKIGDFGLVVELTRDVSDAMAGDSKYMAPELMEGMLSKAADIFSLGITILELACSLELPRGGSLWHELRNNKLPLEFTQGLSDDLILLVSNMMDRKPEKRPTVKDIVNKPSVIQAIRTKSESCDALDSKQFTVNPFSYFIQMLLSIWTLFFNFLKGEVNWKVANKVAITPPPPIVFEQLEEDYDVPNEGHESLQESIMQHEMPNYSPITSPTTCYSQTSCSTPLLIKPHGGQEIRPLFNRESPLIQSVSNKIDGDMWSFSPSVSSRTRKSCSTPRPEDCSPSLSPVSDRAVRSKLFSCSDDDEEPFKNINMSTNLIKAFEDSDSQWE